MMTLIPSRHHRNWTRRLVLAGLVVVCGTTIWGQEPESPDEPSRRSRRESRESHETLSSKSRGRADRVMIGHDVRVQKDEEIKDLVVVGGNAVIDGKVRDLVVVLGNVKLGPTAEVVRDLVVVGGTLEADPEAVTRRERVVLGLGGSALSAPWGQRAVEWVQQGLFRARPLPPKLSWVWAGVGVCVLLYAVLGLLFPRSWQHCVQTLEAKPGSSLLVGLLTGVVALLLSVFFAITVIGAPLLPFLWCAMGASLVFGKLTVYRYSGQQIAASCGVNFLATPWPALGLGLLLFGLLYTVPVIGMAAWLATVPLGMGAVVLAFSERFRAERVASAVGTSPVTATAGMESVTLAEPSALWPRVGFWRRFFATVLDFFLVGLVTSPLVFSKRAPGFFIIFWLIYHVGFWTWKGTTVGGIVTGVRLLREDGRPVTFAVALVRSLASCFSAAVLFLGFFWAGWSRDKQSWHDKIAGTIAVRPAKSSALL